MSGLVRVDFCDTVTGDLVGYGLVRYQDLVDCEGTITSTMVREYFGLDDVSQGAGLPAGWEVCVPVSSGGGLSLVDVDGTALTSGDSVLRGMVFEDATPLDTDGNGNQVLELDCSMQKDGSNQIGVSPDYFQMQNSYSAQFLSAFSNYAIGTVLAIPNSTLININNPCPDRPFQYMIYVQHENETYNNVANTHWNALYVSDYSLNGGAPVNLWFTTGPATAPVGTTYSAGGTSSYREKKSILLGPFTIVAGGSHTFQRINGSVTTIAKQGVGTTRYMSEINIKFFGRIL